MSPTLLVDLDGTLANSLPDLAAALLRLLRARGLAAPGEAEAAGFVGDGVKALLDRAFAAQGRTVDPPALAEFLADYGAHIACATRAYPGIEGALRALA